MEEVIEQLQLSALYHASQSTIAATEVFSRCDLDDFEPNQQQKVGTILVQMLREDFIEPLAVQERMMKESQALHKWFCMYVADNYYTTASYCAARVHEYANKRRLIATLTTAQAALERNNEVPDVIGELQRGLAITEAHVDSSLPIISLEDMLATEDDIRPWIVPSMLRTNERLIITGPEGGGKSVLVAQICLGASMGVNTLHESYASHDPMRVLMLDVENDKLQIRDNARKVWPYLKSFTDAKPDIEWVDIQHIDLSDPVDEQKVIRLAKERMPHLMYLGSLYRLAPEGDKVDAMFTHVSRTVDRIRAETGASVVLEAHAGHGMANDRNGMRPYGSSMWMRWPEFGIGMNKDRTSGYTRLKAWRGHRSDDRQWPVALRRGEAFPWQAIQADEWEAMGYDSE